MEVPPFSFRSGAVFISFLCVVLLSPSLLWEVLLWVLHALSLSFVGGAAFLPYFSVVLPSSSTSSFCGAAGHLFEI